NVNGREYDLFPEPKDLHGATVEQLRLMQFSNRKAEYLLDLSRAVVNGDLELEKTGKSDYHTALNNLLAVRGIGIWSANYILMRGAGHLDCLPLGDSGLHRAVRNLYKLKKAPEKEKVEKLAAPFAPYRSLYTLYLWYSLLDE
ncbi:MAG: DNA-3-methyladenine glycosylase, partial [Candidatus Zixiibacteriota bacterium]